MSPVTSRSASELLISSTVLPPLPARPAMAWPMFPLPMMVMCAMSTSN